MDDLPGADGEFGSNFNMHMLNDFGTRGVKLTPCIRISWILTCVGLGLLVIPSVIITANKIKNVEI